MVSITLDGRVAQVDGTMPGSAGERVRFRFSSLWEGLQKTVCFSGRGGQINMPLHGEDCVVPSEILAAPGQLRVGVFGIGNGKIISTVWAEIGREEA